MTSLETGIIVTVSVIALNLIVFSLIPIGIKKLINKNEHSSNN